jgi:hypothetical protein
VLGAACNARSAASLFCTLRAPTQQASKQARKRAPREASVFRHVAPTAFFSVTTASRRTDSSTSPCGHANHTQTRVKPARQACKQKRACGRPAGGGQDRRAWRKQVAEGATEGLRGPPLGGVACGCVRTAREAMVARPAQKPGAAARSQRCSCSPAASRAAPSVPRHAASEA